MADMTHLSVKMKFNTQHLPNTKHSIKRRKNADRCFSSLLCIAMHMLSGSEACWFKLLFCVCVGLGTYIQAKRGNFEYNKISLYMYIYYVFIVSAIILL